MALIISSVSLDIGIVIEGAYARIDTISGSKDSLDFTLNYYLNQASFSAGKALIYSQQFRFTPSVDDGSANFIEQGYVFTKSLPDFIDAVDA